MDTNTDMGKIAMEFWFFFLPIFEGPVKNFIFPHRVIFLFNIDEWLDSEPSLGSPSLTLIYSFSEQAPRGWERLAQEHLPLKIDF